MTTLPQTDGRPVRERPLASLAIMAGDPPTHRLSSRMVDGGAAAHRLFLAVPKAAAPAGGYPVLYMLDGNGAFDFLTEELLASAPELVVAGIGYDTPYRFDTFARTRDYSPAWPGEGLRPDPERPERLIGGADPFLDRLTGGLRAAAEEGLAIDPDRRAIWGHSMAGLLALYALLTRPMAFARFLAVSPSIWWGDGMMLDLERRAGTPADAAREVLVMLSDSERRSSAAGPHWDGPAPHTLEMIERLRARAGLTVHSRIFEGLAHAGTLPASLAPALRFAVSGD